MPQNRTFSCTFCFTNRTFGFIVSFIDNKRIVVRCKTFRWPAIRHEDEMEKAYEEYFEGLADGEEALSFAEFVGALS